MRFSLPLALLLSLAAIAAEQQPPGYLDGPLVLAVDGPIALAHQEQILAELAALDRVTLADDDWAKQWAGVYRARDAVFSNSTIRIAPQAGIAYTSFGCMGMDGADWGEIVEAFPGGIRVKLAITEGEKPRDYLSSTLYFVRWGDQQFLVPQRQMKRLVANYNAGGQTRECMPGIPRRVADDGREPKPRVAMPSVRPQLPAEFAALIIERPTALKITRIKLKGEIVQQKGSKDKFAQGELELAGGRDEGLFVGTEIGCSAGQRTGVIHLDRVDAKTSHGTFFVNLHDASAEMLKPGDEVFLPGAQPEAAAAK
jgi:hypothetical protein